MSRAASAGVGHLHFVSQPHEATVTSECQTPGIRPSVHGLHAGSWQENLWLVIRTGWPNTCRISSCN